MSWGEGTKTTPPAAGIMEEMETFFILKTKTLTRNAEGFFFPKYLKGCHIHTIHEPDKSQTSGTRVGWR